jgi:hypothetical protein
LSRLFIISMLPRARQHRSRFLSFALRLEQCTNLSKFTCQTCVSRDALAILSIANRINERLLQKNTTISAEKAIGGNSCDTRRTKLFGGTSIYLCRHAANSEYEIAARRDDETSIRQVRPAKFHRNLFTTGKSIISIRNKNFLARTSFPNHV